VGLLPLLMVFPGKVMTSENGISPFWQRCHHSTITISIAILPLSTADSPYCVFINYPFKRLKDKKVDFLKLELNSNK